MHLMQNGGTFDVRPKKILVKWSIPIAGDFTDKIQISAVKSGYWSIGLFSLLVNSAIWLSNHARSFLHLALSGASFASR